MTLRAALRKSFTVQSATLADDGLEPVKTWAETATVTGTLAPASRSALETAQLLGVTATHSVVLPAGLSVTPETTRLVSGGVTYVVVQATTTPVAVTALVRSVA